LLPICYAARLIFMCSCVEDETGKQVKSAVRIKKLRDGVSESQFNQVLNIELEQTIEVCKFLDEI
jgi:hypothetical protein